MNSDSDSDSDFGFGGEDDDTSTEEEEASPEEEATPFIFCIESFLFVLFQLNFLLLGWRFRGGGGNCGSNGRGNECCHCTSTVSVALLPLCRAVAVFMVHFYDLGKSPFQKLPVLDMKFGKISHSAPVYTIRYPKRRNCCLFLLFNHYLDLPELDNNIVTCSSQEHPLVGDSIPKISIVWPQGCCAILQVIHRWNPLIMYFFTVCFISRKIHSFRNK